MCQALTSLEITPATEEEARTTVMRLQAALAVHAFTRTTPPGQPVEELAQIVGKPSIRARMRRGYRDSFTKAIRRIEELLSQRGWMNETLLIGRLWDIVNERDLNLALARSARAVHRVH